MGKIEPKAARIKRHNRVRLKIAGTSSRPRLCVFRSLNHVDKNIWLVDKVLWAQEEVLIGSLLAFEQTRWKWAKDWFIKMYNYVHDKWPLAKHGHALWDNGTDRKVTYVENYNRVENYHHPRHLMLNLLALDRLISRQG